MNILNRNDSTGRLLNMAFPVIATLGVNAIIFTQGWDQSSRPALESVWWAPPGWMVGAIWVVLYAFYGLSRWTAAIDDNARSRAWLVVLLMLWGLSYPWLTQKFDPTIGAYLNVVSLVFSLSVAAELWPVSRKAVYWLVPSILWESFAVCLGFAMLQAA